METKYDLTEKAKTLVRLSSALQNLSAGSAFGPGVPPQAMYEDEPPRHYEYQPGVNMVTVPRLGYGLLSFQQLRALGQASKEIRLNIELIKRQMRGLRWDIVPAAGSQVPGAVDPQIEAVRKWFDIPDGLNDFDQWINILLEDMLVIDAVTLYPNYESGVLRLEIIDGSTIRPLLNMRGATPAPPAPAYLQMLYGVPWSNYPATSLLYKPLNTKVTSPYGESPIEWVLTAVNTAIRHDIQRSGYFTDGNIPGALVFLGDVTTEQAAMFDAYVDALSKGDIARANRLIFLPGGGDKSVFPFQQNGIDVTTLDTWLMQIACWAYGNSPAEFGIIPGQGLGGVGYLAGAENIHYRSMIGPITGYLDSLFNLIIRRYLGCPSAKFTWLGLEPPEDKLQQAQVDQAYLQAGVYTIQYVQDRLEVPEKYRAAAPTGINLVPAVPPAQLTPALSPYFQRAIKAELDTWREKATRAMKKGWPMPDFKSDILPEELLKSVSEGLKKAQTTDQVSTVFEAAVPQEGNGERAFFRSYP